jgi:hypothetical protein
MELFFMFQFLILVSVIAIVVGWIKSMPTLPAPPELKSTGFSQSLSNELDPITNTDNDEWFFFYNDL